MITLYHGTSTLHLDNVRQVGLKAPYLTSDRSMAEYFAGEASAAVGGDPAILAVEVEESRLQVDYAMMDEPIGTDRLTSSQMERRRDLAWKTASREHPEWLNEGFLAIPATEWRLSLETVFSVCASGMIPPSQVRVLDPAPSAAAR